MKNDTQELKTVLLESVKKKDSELIGKEISLMFLGTSQLRPLTLHSKITSKIYSDTKKIEMVMENGWQEI